MYIESLLRAMMFASDNTSGVHPEILEAIVLANVGHVQSYGMDHHTEKMIQTFRKIFQHPVDVFPVFNGTAANVLGLGALVRPHEGIICADTSHLNVDECGAPERWIGAKLFTIPSRDGKIYPEDIIKVLIRKGDQHYSQAKVLSITQPTELGTTYSVSELKALKELCREHKLLFHMDGARLANACVSLDCELHDLTTKVGVDLLSFGGTKNGLMNAEAIVFFQSELSRLFKFHRKQGLQLASKHRFLAVQFTAYLETGLWKRIAEHQFKLARELAHDVSQIPGIEIIGQVQSNGVFAKVPKHLIGPLKDEYFFYVWDEFQHIVRWMITWDHRSEDVAAFVASIRRILSTHE